MATGTVESDADQALSTRTGRRERQSKTSRRRSGMVFVPIAVEAIDEESNPSK